MQSDNSHVLLAHQIGIYQYGTLDRNRAAFIQEIAEKDAQKNERDILETNEL
jgi:hypothetical protein